KNVKFYFSSDVEQIITKENRVVAVIANDLSYAADVVVSNVDVYFTYKHLLNDPVKAANILKQERSSSAFIFYWGMNTVFP
ncbi:hypothetical protein ABTL74_19460, partial [Acinetobacter baumannii]